ncbi:MAG: glycosyltransferase, partial [Flavobacterium sp.]|uniref:glycosyltransferase n=1 Tax=Flavobacterium sp. TaxID=239 RepID=UPI0026112011
PTYFDGIPGSIRETMFMGIPVISYAVGGIPSLNETLECITLVEKQNITELVAKIELVLDDHERTNRLVENALKVITEKYDTGRIYDNLLSIYNDILNSKKRDETN